MPVVTTMARRYGLVQHKLLSTLLTFFFQGGMVIGLPPVMNFGSAELKAKIIHEVLQGKKFISLAISEAFAGSDVAGLRCDIIASRCISHVQQQHPQQLHSH
jgi:alkylation response protein AidB-like acyl-CoA dehydrogenase